jgi:hypothetical protein
MPSHIKKEILQGQVRQFEGVADSRHEFRVEVDGRLDVYVIATQIGVDLVKRLVWTREKTCIEVHGRPRAPTKLTPAKAKDHATLYLQIMIITQLRGKRY